MYQDYILALKPFGSVLFCYVFQGAPYPALKKVDTLLAELQSAQLFQDTLKANMDQNRQLLEDEIRFQQNIMMPNLS